LIKHKNKKMATVNFGIIDDGFPVTQKTQLEFNDIQHLTGIDEWGFETSLRDLNVELISKSIHLKKRINVTGFYNPEFFFNSKKKSWDYISFDWEYKMQQADKEPEDYLLEILKNTQAKIYVFTGWEKRIHISSIIDSGEFKAFRDENRLEMLEKNEDDSVAQMLQSVTELFERGEELSFGEGTILIKPSRFILDSDDFWMLRSLLGSDNIKSILSEEKSSVIDEGTIHLMFEKSKFQFFIDKENSVLSASKNQLVESKFGVLDELTMSEALSIFGIEKLVEAREKGFTTIK